MNLNTPQTHESLPQEVLANGFCLLTYIYLKICIDLKRAVSAKTSKNLAELEEFFRMNDR